MWVKTDTHTLQQRCFTTTVLHTEARGVSETTKGLTILGTDPLVLHNIVVVKIAQNLDFFIQVSYVSPSGSRLQRLDRHQLPGVVTFRVISAQLHFTKVTLQTNREEMRLLETHGQIRKTYEAYSQGIQQLMSLHCSFANISIRAAVCGHNYRS